MLLSQDELAVGLGLVENNPVVLTAPLPFVICELLESSDICGVDFQSVLLLLPVVVMVLILFGDVSISFSVVLGKSSKSLLDALRLPKYNFPKFSVVAFNKLKIVGLVQSNPNPVVLEYESDGAVVDGSEGVSSFAIYPGEDDE